MNPEKRPSSRRRAAAASQAPSVPGYEIQSVVGEGSMGRVYRARQLSMDRDVAIKFLPANLASNERYARQFVHEARTVARLGHLNIVTGIDVGEHGGNYYFVMEFLDGDTVGDVLRRGETFDERRAVEIARQIASALEHARENGLVHRDVKPDNILMTSDGTPKLGDLGLALRADSAQPTKIAGTPQYISPEAVRREEVDTRSDIYSLGVSLLHMISGKMPFEGTAREVIQKHVTEGVPELRAVAPSSSARAAILVAGMTAMDPSERYQTPAEVVKAATVYLEQPGKSMPRPAGMAVQLGGRPASARRRRGSAGTLLACLVIAMVGVGIWWSTNDGGANSADPVVDGNTSGELPPVDGRTPRADTTGGSTRDADGQTNRDRASERETEAARAFEQARLYLQENPADFDGTAKRLHAVGERFPGTEYGQKAIDEITRLDRERSAAASAEFDRIEREAESLVERAELGRALEVWRTFPVQLTDSDPGKRARQTMGKLQERIKQEVASGIALALANAEPTGDEAADFGAALQQLQDLRDRMGTTGEADLATAMGRVRQLEDDQRRAAEVAAREQIREARKLLRDADDRVTTLLQAFDIPGALAIYTDLEKHPGVASDPALAQELTLAAEQVRRLGDVDARVRAELTRQDGERVKYDGRRGFLVTGGSAFSIRIGSNEESLDLSRLDESTLGEMATEGVTDGAGLVDAATYLLCAGAFDAAAETAERAVGAGADAALVAALQKRLEAARAAAQEREAEALWGESVLLLEREKWNQAGKLLRRLVEDLSATAFFAAHRFEIEDALALAEGDGTPPPLIDKILRGKVKIIKATPGAPLVVEVTYDFESPDQLEDFEKAAFRLPGLGGRGGGEAEEDAPKTDDIWTVEDGKLTGAGNDQLYWRPQLVGDLVLTYEYTTPRHKNLGMNLYDGGKGKYWSAIFGLDIGGGGGGGRGRMGRGLGSNRNFLIKVDPGAVADYDGPEWQAWVQAFKDQSARPEIAPGRKYQVQVQVKGELIVFATGKNKLSIKDTDFRRGRISWFAYGNEIYIDKLKIRAHIDTGWLAEAEEEYRKAREKAEQVEKKKKEQEKSIFDPKGVGKTPEKDEEE